MKQLIETVFGSWKRFFVAWGMLIAYFSVMFFVGHYFNFKPHDLQEYIVGSFLYALYSSILISPFLFFIYLRTDSSISNIFKYILKRWKYIISISVIMALSQFLPQLFYILPNQFIFIVIKFLIGWASLLFGFPALFAACYAMFTPMWPYEAIVESNRHGFSRYFLSDLKLLIFPILLYAMFGVISKFVHNKYLDYVMFSLIYSLFYILFSTFVIRRLSSLGRLREEKN